MIANAKLRSRQAVFGPLAMASLIGGCMFARTPPQTSSAPQPLSALQTGDRIRVRLAGDPTTRWRHGTVIALERDSLRIRRFDKSGAPTEVVAVGAVRSIEVRRRGERPLAYCVNGALVTGLVAGAAAARSDDRETSQYAGLTGIGVGVYFGCPGGFILGFLFDRYGSWQALVLPHSTAPPAPTWHPESRTKSIGPTLTRPPGERR